MEERRLLLAVALSFLALTAFRLLFPGPAVPPGPTPTPTTRPAASAEPAGGPPAASAQPGGPTPGPTPGASPAAPAERPARPEVVAAREQRIEASGPAAEIAFTNRGARVLSWRLREYQDRRGNAEEMVTESKGGPQPLDVETGDRELDARLREALFQPSSERLAIPAEGSAELSFRFAQGNLEAEKHLRFSRGGYLVEVEARVRRDGRELARRLLWAPGVGNPTSEEMSVQGYHPPQAVALAGGSVQRFEPAKLEKPLAPAGARWGGVEAQYFAALWVLPPSAVLQFERVPLPPGPDGKERLGPLAAVELPANAAGAELYVGPKDYHKLKRLAPGLERVVPVGNWIGPIVVPLLNLLRLAHGLVGNYGWSIVLLTVLINLAMAPLRHYSISNGLKMSRLAPEMRAIQERYRKLPMLDPKRQEMNEEIGALYARHGMSMGTQMTVGCLPLLATMPFLVAFYTVLTVSIDLRGAGFLWMADLSQRDPLYLTPILMGLSMFLMQRMMPTTVDPAQQRIMMMMPIVLTAMLFAAPGGLNLYWLASNLCSIVQQAVTLKLLGRGDAQAQGPGRKR